jgi:hypothetical protein
MECVDCRTTEGFYAYKIDQFDEARECKKAPIGYLVNTDGNDYIHQCPNGRIQGKQCMGHGSNTCAPGQYWSGSACISPEYGKKTKRGAYGDVNVYDECPAGTKTDGDACIECPYWQYQPLAGQTTCFNCPGGTEYGPGSGSGKTTCEICSDETYSWDEAQEITFEKATSLWPDINTNNIWNYNREFDGSVKGYTWKKISDHGSDEHTQSETDCNNNIYCSGVIRMIRYTGSSTSSSRTFSNADFYLFTTVPITEEMKAKYPNMTNAVAFDSANIPTFDPADEAWYATGLGKFDRTTSAIEPWSLHKKDPIREVLHSIEAHRNPLVEDVYYSNVAPNPMDVMDSFDSCYSCEGDYTAVIANVSQGYPYVDKNSDEKYRECIEDRDKSLDWQREQADCTDVNSIPTGLWVPEKTIYFTDYIFDKNGNAIQESVVVPAHCEKDKSDTTCAGGYMTIEKAGYDFLGRMIALPVCWESMNISKGKVFIYEDEREDSLKDISIVSNNVRCHPFDVLPNVTYVGTVHTKDDWTPRNDITTFSRDIDILNTLDMVANDFDATNFEVTATCNVTKFYAHSDTASQNGLDDSTYDDIICPGATYKCDADVSSSDGKDACENTGNTYIFGYWRQEEYTRSYYNYRTQQYETRTEFRNKYVPSICKNGNATIATGGTQQDCEKTGKTFKVECPDGDRRLWHIENKQLKMVSTNLYIPPKCDSKYYVAEDNCTGTFTSAKCEDEDGNVVNMTSPAKCVMGQYAHFCDHYGNNDIVWTSWDTHSSPMSTFCRQFDNDPYLSTGICAAGALFDSFGGKEGCLNVIRQQLYDPIIHVVMRHVHSHQMNFDVEVKPDDADEDDIHDRDDNCPKTSTTPAFGFVSSEGCAYNQKSSNEYKEYLYEEHCSHRPDSGNHEDCSVFTSGKQPTIPAPAPASTIASIPTPAPTIATVADTNPNTGTSSY